MPRMPLCIAALHVVLSISHASAANVVSRRSPISDKADDVEIRLPNSGFSAHSSDLELGHHRGAQQVVGLRFRNARIPRGAEVEEAYVTFTAEATDGGESPSLLIRGEARDRSEQFSSRSPPVGRRETKAGVSWRNLGRWSKGRTYRTPGLAGIINELTDRPGWSPSSALTLLVSSRSSGTSRRSAWSLDGSPSHAPVLFVKYRVGGRPSMPPLVVPATPPPPPPVPVGGGGGGVNPPARMCGCGPWVRGLQGIFWRNGMTSGLSKLPRLGRGSALRESTAGRVDRAVPNLDQKDTGSAWAGLPAAYTSNFVDLHIGFLQVPARGVYTLHVTSNDGSRVLLNGKAVVDNDGNHRMQTRSSQKLTLNPGAHDLEVQHYQGRGTAGLRLEWTRPDGTRQVVPRGSLGFCNCGTPPSPRTPTPPAPPVRTPRPAPAPAPSTPRPTSPSALGGVDLRSEKLRSEKLFKTNSYKLSSGDNSYSPVMTDGTNTFYAWVGDDLRPRVTKISGSGSAHTILLDSNADYRALDDGHHKFSVGIDSKGYIHVTGDMHHHPASNNKHLPTRYRNSIVMYWVSRVPRSIDTLEFVGNNKARAIPGYGFSYGNFNVAPDGTLFYLSRVRVHKRGHHEGEMGLAVFRYSASSQRWTGLGGLPPSARKSEYPVVLWEDNGHKRSFYQAYRCSMKFDPSGTMHIAAVINNDSGKSRPTHAVYLASDDLGNTFRRADGRAIPDMPARVDAGSSQTDVVYGPRDDYDLFAGVFYNARGEPAVSFSRNDGGWKSEYVYWDAAKRRWSSPVASPAGGGIRHSHQTDPSGVVTFVGSSRLVRSKGFAQEGVTHGLNVWLNAVDENALRSSNTWIGVYENRARNEQGVMKLSFK